MNQHSIHIEHNRFWSSIEEFLKHDKHLHDLKKYRFVHEFGWWGEIAGPAVYLLFGPRQIGKTTSLKVFIQHLLTDKRVAPADIFYISCDLLVDRIQLDSQIRDFYDRAHQGVVYMMLDEITSIENWQLVIKALIDQGIFGNTVLVITGSDALLLEDASAAFPGIDRRGKNAKDFTLSPLTFREFVTLVGENSSGLDYYQTREGYHELEGLFYNYLKCGGFPNAINELMTAAEIPLSLLKVYQDWIISDLIRKGKERAKLIELFSVLITRFASQLSFNRIAQQSASLSTNMVIDYVDHLERIGVLRVLSAIDQNSLTAAPKKDKKFYFTDPILLHSIVALLKNAELLSAAYQVDETLLVESVSINNYARSCPAYYIKGNGEVDLALVRSGGFYPIEIKWTEKAKAGGLREIKKYDNALILSRHFDSGNIDNIPVRNLLLELLASPEHVFER